MAHGESPRVLALVAIEANGVPAVLRLDEGLALRRASEWRYLCPALWGDDEMGPAAALSGGDVVVVGGDGREGGLFLVEAGTGEVRAHPDALARAGRTIALRGHGGRVLQLRFDRDLTQLADIGREAVRIVFSDTGPWDAMDVGTDAAVLVRLVGDDVEQLSLGPDGEELGRVRTRAPDGTVSVTPRVVEGRIFLVALTAGGLASELAEIQGGSWTTLHTSAGSISGPVERADGTYHLASGGQLGVLDAQGGVRSEDEDAVVTCLQQQPGRAACADTGLRELDDAGLGATLFDLSGLLEPDLSRVPDEFLTQCQLQWQRYTLDLRGLGIEAPSPSGPAPVGDAGVRDAARPLADAGVHGADTPVQDAGGCHVGGGRPGACGTAQAPMLLLLVGLLLRRRVRGAQGCASPGWLHRDRRARGR